MEQNFSHNSFPIFYCPECNYETTHKGTWKRHIFTPKHFANCQKTIQKKCKYHCIDCDFKTSHKGSWQRHLSTRKHIWKKSNPQADNITLYDKNPYPYKCQKCNYFTMHEGMWNRHLTTKRHSWLNYVTIKSNKAVFTCTCGKTYKYQSGLCKHRHACTKETKNVETELVETLLNTNKELQELVKEQIYHTTDLMSKQENLIVSTNNITNNTMNNQFNINFFLNEQCKDALNLTDFIGSLQVQLEDLNNTNRSGFVKGISTAFIRGLKELDMYQRPIHCSDIKRTIMYVKDDDQWLKEDQQKDKIKKSIKEIGHGKFIKLIKEWEKHNPDWAETDQGRIDYTKMVQSVTRDLEENTENKIIKNIAKEVLIDKQCN
jgi:hypothetical protein